MPRSDRRAFTTREALRGVGDAAPYTRTQRPPCVKGDSPQCGEMSRSDRGARARRAPAKRVGDCDLAHKSTYPAHAPIPPSRLTPCHLPLHKGGFAGRRPRRPVRSYVTAQLQGGVKTPSYKADCTRPTPHPPVGGSSPQGEPIYRRTNLALSFNCLSPHTY